MIKIEELNLIETKAIVNKNSCHSEGGVSFIYHKDGKRVEFSKRIYTMLGEPTNVTFKMSDDYLIIMADENGHKINKTEKSTRAVIYNAALVKEILDFYGIDESCSSYSEVETIEGFENAVALKMR